MDKMLTTKKYEQQEEKKMRQLQPAKYHL